MGIPTLRNLSKPLWTQLPNVYSAWAVGAEISDVLFTFFFTYLNNRKTVCLVENQCGTENRRRVDLKLPSEMLCHALSQTLLMDFSTSPSPPSPTSWVSH